MTSDTPRAPSTQVNCPCGGACHHAEHPCSLGCWSAQKPWRVEETRHSLDVDVLARALVFRRYGIRVESANPADVADAEAVAREYARLITATPEPGGPG